MRDEQDFVAVRRLVADGLSDYAVARRTGVPRSTVQNWRRCPAKRLRTNPSPRWRPPDAAAYCYLLGLYLGDGHITARGRSATICLSLDVAYPGLIREATEALAVTFPGSRAHRYDHRAARGVAILQLSGGALRVAFPQHGPGRKHLRRIELADWQAELTARHPRALLRGLIHSDGCRCVNRFKTRLPSGRLAEYEYVRYFFSNLSADIRRIFCRHCDLVGVHWTQPSHRNISVSKRASVALLDSFVGPKV